MREISTEKIKVGEHVIIDGVEYVAEEEMTECVIHVRLENHTSAV